MASPPSLTSEDNLDSYYIQIETTKQELPQFLAAKPTSLHLHAFTFTQICFPPIIREELSVNANPSNFALHIVRAIAPSSPPAIS